MERTLTEKAMSDGQWHTLLLLKHQLATSLRVDNSPPKEILHLTQDFGGVNVLTLSLGGVPSESVQKDGSGESVILNLMWTSKHSSETPLRNNAELYLYHNDKQKSMKHLPAGIDTQLAYDVVSIKFQNDIPSISLMTLFLVLLRKQSGPVTYFEKRLAPFGPDASSRAGIQGDLPVSYRLFLSSRL